MMVIHARSRADDATANVCGESIHRAAQVQREHERDVISRKLNCAMAKKPRPQMPSLDPHERVALPSAVEAHRNSGTKMSAGKYEHARRRIEQLMM